jgi:hypothetical protein
MRVTSPFRVFDIKFLLIPLGTSKACVSWKENGTTYAQKYIEVFIFGIRVARFQIGDVG